VSRVALVVFDLDGTLIDSAGDLAASVNAALERLAPGTPPVPPERVRTFIGDGAGTLVARTLAAAGVDITTEQALPVFLECYSARLLETTALYPGVAEALDALRDRRLAVLTNKPGDMSRTILAGLGVAGRFARICGAGDVPAKKPDPAGLQMLLAEAGVGPQAAVLVGDSAIDVRTGRAAGVRTVGVTYGLDPGSLRATPPDLLVDDLRELPGRLAAPAPA
jgi:phosphoglycolate phosphatase